MSRLLRVVLALLLVLFQSLMAEEVGDARKEAEEHKAWVRANYSKFEYRIPMRDGTRLFTTVYRPNWSREKFPIILMRTPYSAGPYGASHYRAQLGPYRAFDKEGFIFCFQDVRGRFLSEGNFDNMRSHGQSVNESTDTYDTIDWLTRNLPRNNGRVGQWGISYPGFYTASGMISNHPALKIASPQAPIADWFWDDMHHNGAFCLQLAFNFFSVFGVKHDGPWEEWPERFKHKTPDGYRFFLNLGPLANVNKNYLKGEIDFWNKLTEHPNYDEFWKARSILPYLKNVNCTVLTVGGWYDAEDLYGPLEIYRNVEKNNPLTTSTLVMGPWFHGAWVRDGGDRLGDTPFDFPTAEFFQKQVMLPLFLSKLKDKEDPELPEALVFETGANRWREFDSWPPPSQEKTLYLNAGQSLTFTPPKGEQKPDSFVSDPAHPVPSTATITIRRRREMMSEDQRYASSRPDVLTFESEVLKEDVNLVGPLQVELWVSTNQTAADWVVKLVDVYPGEEKPRKIGKDTVSLGGAELLVRHEIIRGRFRDGFDSPKPFVPNKVTRVPLRLMDVCHDFQRGHRIMIQIQSSHFPFFDRNPQKYVPNIFDARESDFVRAEHKVWHSAKYPSRIKVRVLK